jgi:hypothetical protein
MAFYFGEEPPEEDPLIFKAVVFRISENPIDIFGNPFLDWTAFVRPVPPQDGVLYYTLNREEFSGELPCIDDVVEVTNTGKFMFSARVLKRAKDNWKEDGF